MQVITLDGAEIQQLRQLSETVESSMRGSTSMIDMMAGVMHSVTGDTSVIIKMATSTRNIAHEKSIFEAIRNKDTNSCCIRMYGADASNRYIILERFGSDMRSIIESPNPLLQNNNVLAKAVLSLMADFHKCGYMHGDIKPQNILVQFKDARLFMKLCDLECATKFGDPVPVGKFTPG